MYFLACFRFNFLPEMISFNQPTSTLPLHSGKSLKLQKTAWIMDLMYLHASSKFLSTVSVQPLPSNHLLQSTLIFVLLLGKLFELQKTAWCMNLTSMDVLHWCEYFFIFQNMLCAMHFYTSSDPSNSDIGLIGILNFMFICTKIPCSNVWLGISRVYLNFF